MRLTARTRDFHRATGFGIGMLLVVSAGIAAPPPAEPVIADHPSSQRSGTVVEPGPRACNRLEGRVLLDDPPKSRDVELVFSGNYRSRPCFLADGGRIEVQVLVPEWRRPVRIVLRQLERVLPDSYFDRFRIGGGGEKPRKGEGSGPGVSIKRPKDDPNTKIFRFTGGQMIIDLPKLAPLTTGSVFGHELSASPCRPDGWLVFVEFADGSRSEAIGGLIGDCGKPGYAPGVRGSFPG